MERPSEGERRSKLDEIKEAIRTSAEKIEEEFKRTANSWLACFASRVFVVETLLELRGVTEELGVERLQTVRDRLEVLKTKLHEYYKQYPEKDTDPPLKMKQELISLLDIFHN